MVTGMTQAEQTFYSQQSDYIKGWQNSDWAKKDRIGVQRLYVDMTGYLTDGIIFSRIMYWFEPSKKTGRTRATVVRDGYLWLAKNYDDWWKEVRIDERTARSSIGRMVESGLLIKETHKYAGSRTVYLRINWKVFEELTRKYAEFSVEELRSQKRSKRQKMSDTEDVVNDIKCQTQATKNDTSIETTLNVTSIYTPDLQHNSQHDLFSGSAANAATRINHDSPNSDRGSTLPAGQDVEHQPAVTHSKNEPLMDSKQLEQSESQPTNTPPSPPIGGEPPASPDKWAEANRLYDIAKEQLQRYYDKTSDDPETAIELALDNLQLDWIIYQEQDDPAGLEAEYRRRIEGYTVAPVSPADLDTEPKPAPSADFAKWYVQQGSSFNPYVGPFDSHSQAINQTKHLGDIRSIVPGNDMPANAKIEPLPLAPAAESGRVTEPCFVKGCTQKADYFAHGHPFCHMHARIVESLPDDYDPETYVFPETTSETKQLPKSQTPTPVNAVPDAVNGMTKSRTNGASTEPPRSWQVGDRVYHKNFGEAVVLAIKAKTVSILTNGQLRGTYLESLVKPTSLYERRTYGTPLDTEADRRIAEARAKAAKQTKITNVDDLDPIFVAYCRLFSKTHPLMTYNSKQQQGLVWAQVGEVVNAEKALLGLDSDQPLDADNRKRVAGEMTGMALWFDQECKDCKRPTTREKFGKLVLQWYEAGKPNPSQSNELVDNPDHPGQKISKALLEQRQAAKREFEEKLAAQQTAQSIDKTSIQTALNHFGGKHG